jgi:hypothetical protein
MLADAQVHKKNVRSLDWIRMGRVSWNNSNSAQSEILISITHTGTEKLLYSSLSTLGLKGEA